MISAVICDLDGLISDTEGLHLKAYLETFSSLRIELTTEQYQEHWIRKGLGVGRYVEINNLPFDPKELHSQKAVSYKRIVSEFAEPMPGAVEFLKRTHGVKKLALASNWYFTQQALYRIFIRVRITLISGPSPRQREMSTGL